MESETDHSDFFKILFALGVLNFGHCDLFGICYLFFGIFILSGFGASNL